MCFPCQMFYTLAQLAKFYRQFAHPSADKLYNILRRARPEDTSPSFLKPSRISLGDAIHVRGSSAPLDVLWSPSMQKKFALMSDSSWKSCTLMAPPCCTLLTKMRISQRRHSFLTTRPHGSRNILHSAGHALWRTFLECWVAVYTGLPRTLIVDQGSNFGEALGSMAEISKIEVRRIGIEPHSSVEIWERYHEPLHTTYRKLRIYFPKPLRELLLCFSLKTMNGTLGHEGFLPPSLVYGEYPQ